MRVVLTYDGGCGVGGNVEDVAASGDLPARFQPAPGRQHGGGDVLAAPSHRQHQRRQTAIVQGVPTCLKAIK